MTYTKAQLAAAKAAVDVARKAAESCACKRPVCEHVKAYEAAITAWFASMGK